MKPLMRPIALTPSPAPMIVILGGLVGTILLSACLYAGPALGVPRVDVPAALGGMFTSHEPTAFGVGYSLFFLGGTFGFSLAILVAWSLLPGSETGLGGAALKGVLWGVGMWLVTGIGLGIAGALNAVDGADRPGFFAMNAGVAGIVWLLAGCILYGLALTLITAMEHGITALDTLGWTGYYHAATGPTWLDEHRSIDVPQTGQTTRR